MYRIYYFTVLLAMLACGSSGGGSTDSGSSSTGSGSGGTTPNCVLGTHKVGECKVNQHINSKNIGGKHDK